MTCSDTRTASVAGNSANGNHWERHAMQWRHVGLPLRPSCEDIRIMEKLVNAHVQDACPHALLLGVTPELATMAWPAGTRLLAVDRSAGMIRHVWPTTGVAVAADVIRGDWNALPVRDGSLDLVVGDGFYTPLAYPADYRRLGAELVRILRPGGLYLIRAFVRPEMPETLAAIQADFFADRIGSFHALKWRVAMALHGTLHEGVRLAEVWNHWNALCSEGVARGVRTRWPQEEIATINAYRGVKSSYTFPTLDELRAALHPAFAEKACHFPDYELGDRCPILLLAKR